MNSTAEAVKALEKLWAESRELAEAACETQRRLSAVDRDGVEPTESERDRYTFYAGVYCGHEEVQAYTRRVISNPAQALRDLEADLAAEPEPDENPAWIQGHKAALSRAALTLRAAAALFL